MICVTLPLVKPSFLAISLIDETEPSFSFFFHVVSLRFHESIGDVLPRAVKRLKRLMNFFE
jgi:hypothetical protein